jgi:hypothetical protein
MLIGKYLIFNLNKFAENRISANPTVYQSAIIADLKPFTLNRFDEMQIFVSIHFTQNNIAFLLKIKIRDRLDRAKLSRFDLTFHRMPARTKRNRFTIFQFRNVRSCPTHININ